MSDYNFENRNVESLLRNVIINGQIWKVLVLYNIIQEMIISAMCG